MTRATDAHPPVSILGIGAITPLGRDLDTIARRLAAPQSAAGDALCVPDELLNDPAISKRMRRADRFARMTTLAALDAWNRARASCEGISMHRVGLIVSTGFGPHGRGFKFLDGILDCSDSAALPTDFSHSVHGAAAAYITELLELRGPSLNNTDFELGFAEVVLLAQCWLADGTCDRVLVGAAEEVGEVMLHCAGRMLPKGVEKGLGEGAVFIALGPREVIGIAELSVTGCQPVQENESQHDLAARATTGRAFGLSASSCAFELLAMLLTGRDGPIDNAATFTPSSTARAATLLLRRNPS